MKKIIYILAIALSLNIYAKDRAETLNRSSDRSEINRENLDYTPAITEEISRNLMVDNDRNERNRKYRADERFDNFSITKQLNAFSDEKELSIAQTTNKLWQDAYEATPNLLELELNAYQNTYAWYLLVDAKKAQSNLELEDIIYLLQEVSK